MKNCLHPGLVLLAAVFAVAAALPFAATAGSRRDFYFFEVELTSTRAGQTQVFFDMGNGINEDDSSKQPLRTGEKPVNYRYMLPTGTLRGFRFDPIDREGTMTIAHARIVDSGGRLLHAFAPTDFRPVQQIAPLAIDGDVVHMTTDAGAGDPIMEMAMPSPVELRFGMKQKLGVTLPVFGTVWIGLLAIAFVFGSRPVQSRFSGFAAAVARHPIASLAGFAAFAVAVQCHPVIFFGKSFVSPDNAGYLLYDTFPTLPGYQTTELEDGRNSDVGAILYQHIYYPLSQREALADGELPLWNRYNLTGLPLLGQGQSMFGDVLNFLSMATHSASWSWDLRYVIDRWLYAFGIALVVYRITRKRAAATILALTAPFIGFFQYRLNHPAQFSLCYSPWILFGWLLLRDARTWKQRGWALGAWIFFNWEVMTSGTVKEAYMLIACINLAGLLLLLFHDAPWRERARGLGAATAAGAIFVLISAPLWMTLLDTLAVSHSNYDVPAAMQISPTLGIGFFEDLFYRQIHPNENHGNPSTNVIVLVGVAWALACARESLRNRPFLAIGIAALLPLSIVFKIVPVSVIVKIPFVANIQHTDNTFSCSLVVLATVLSGFGLQSFCEHIGNPRWWLRCTAALAIVAAPVAWYFTTHARTPMSAFFTGYIPSLAIAVAAALAGLAVWARIRQPGTLAAILVAAFVLLLWRHGQYLHTPFDTYVFNPKVRADFRAPSPAVAHIDRLMAEPSRPAGFGFNLFSGYNRMLDWEGIFGVDALRNNDYDDLAIGGGVAKVRWGGPNFRIQEDPAEVLPIQDLFNVRYYLATHGEEPREIPGLKFLGAHDLDVYESPTAWPRAFFTDRVTTYRSLPEFVRQVKNGDRRPFVSMEAGDAARVVPLKSISAALDGRTIRAAHDYKLTANTTSFIVEASGPGMIVLTEAYYPAGFTATLDGAPADYVRVNHAFKGIVLQTAGTYHVKFAYWPPHLTLALWLCAAGLLLLAVAAAGCATAPRWAPEVPPL